MPPRLGPPPLLIIVLHDCIPGRVRWHVQGLRGNDFLKAMLEGGLPELPGIHSARASTDTGNLLTLFDPAVPAERVRERIIALLRGDVVPASGGAGPGWHTRPAASVVTELDTSETTGLTAEAARERLAEQGPNALPLPPSRSGLGIFLGQFQTLPVGLLIAAGAFSFVTGGMVEAAAILAVVGFNGVLGTVVENRSERTIRSLGEGGHEPAHVVRDGEAMAIPPEAVVRGDLIELLPGTVVPADARVFHARNLRVSEAMLTGESLPVSKQTEPVGRAVPLGDRTSMVYRGTAVTAGSGSAIVVETGARTQVGRIQRLVSGEGTPPTPMQQQLDHLGRQLVWASLAACAAVMGLGGLRGIALFQLFRSAISLAVAAIPEGLPMVATTTLALGIEDMRKRSVLVRRLDAVESLASVNVVCFDKTGTLTMNQMRVIEASSGGRRFRAGPDAPLLDAEGQPVALEAAPDSALDAQGDPLACLLRIGVLCSNAALVEREGALIPAGSATETALVRLALDLGIDVLALREAHPRLAIRHRAEGYRFMATMHRQPGDESGDALVAVKGNPSEVLDLCAWDLREGVRRPLTAERREAILRVNEAMAAESLRVLGFAFGEASGETVAEQDADDPVPVGGLTWVGLAGMADPVRPGMAALMRTLHGAGLRTVMMTGDQAVTAQAVARQLGLAGDGAVEVFDAANIERLSKADLAAAASRAHVFARVSPAQKLHIIRALQAAGDRVAMTGDGINDSPALKAADIGIAMGGAASSEAAREVADVVLQTDDLATLAVAVERGRMTYVNVRKSIRYMLATNFSEILVVLGATLAGFGEPLTAMQMLWINLVGDVLPGLGLAFEPPEPGLMQRPPHPVKGRIIERNELGHLGAEGGLIAAGSLAVMGWGALRHGPGAEARTMAFGSLMTAQLLHALTARSARHGPLAGTEALPPNRPLAGLLLASAALQGLGLLVPGVRDALGVVPLGPLDFVASTAAGVLPYVANEALKAGRLPGPAS
ncbi:MAG TPA: HAD-IC family P-type ATPase [Acetobacteraceae bacterium]|nr:HAD-IC family P-type ATPase [Acetobacteraceae bacterium]